MHFTLLFILCKEFYNKNGKRVIYIVNNEKDRQAETQYVGAEFEENYYQYRKNNRVHVYINNVTDVFCFVYFLQNAHI